MLKVETTKATMFYVDKKTGVGAAEYSKYEMRLSICECMVGKSLSEGM